MDAEEARRARRKRGLYVTEMMGFGFNAVTGDFSRGAAGFWIENGEMTFPVSEVTISLNLDELLKRIDAVASDLDLRTSIATPTFRVSAMTVAGSLSAADAAFSSATRVRRRIPRRRGRACISAEPVTPPPDPPEETPR